MPITKAVIPAAGRGTRLKPATEIVPKELLPIVTKPALYFVLEEAQNSGLKEIILVVSPEKKPFLAPLEEIFPALKFQFLIQEKAFGLGHAVGMAEAAIGDEPFFVLLPDMIMDHEKPVSLQLAEVFEKVQTCVNASERAEKKNLHLYGVYDVASSEGRLHKAKGVVEKPDPREAPSSLVVTGRYIFTPELFDIQKKTPPGKNGEIQLADAMDVLAKRGRLFAYEFEGKHFDVGHPEGYLKANFYYGVKEYGMRIYQGLV